MTRWTFRTGAFGCAALLLVSGCYTGTGRAESRRQLVQLGMTPDEVRDLLGEPDTITTLPPAGSAGSVLEWRYTYSTPFTMCILPTIGLFTVVLTIPSFYYILGLGMSRSGTLQVEFGSDWRVLRVVPDLRY